MPVHNLKESKRSRLASALLPADSLSHVESGKHLNAKPIMADDSIMLNENNLTDMMFGAIDTNNDHVISYSELDTFLNNNNNN